MPSQTPDNSKITIAVLGTKIDTLTKQLDKIGTQVERALETMDTRVRYLENGQMERQTQIKEIHKILDGLDCDVKTLDIEIDKLKFSDKVWGGFTSAIAVIGSTIAGILGSK